MTTALASGRRRSVFADLDVRHEAGLVPCLPQARGGKIDTNASVSGPAPTITGNGDESPRMRQAWPARFGQLDQVAGMPIVAGAGSRLLRRGDAIIGAISVRGCNAAGPDGACAEAGLASLAA